jgi:uncharacterized tellurite resistance protein B-like protein
MATLTKSDLAALSVEQRLELIDALWDSVDGSLEAQAHPD